MVALTVGVDDSDVAGDVSHRKLGDGFRENAYVASLFSLFVSVGGEGQDERIRARRSVSGNVLSNDGLDRAP